MPNDDVDLQRQAARDALEGEEHKLRREQTEAELEKQREAARLAMESGEQKAHREAEERAGKEKQEAEARRLAEIARIRQMEIDRVEESKRKIAEEMARKAKEQEQVLEKIHRAETTIANLKEQSGGINSVRTLQGDLAQAVERRKISETSIAIKQQDSERIIIDEQPGRSFGKTIALTLGIFILIGAGAGAVWYVSTHQADNGPVAIKTTTPKIITAENSITIETSAITAEALRQKITDLYTSGQSPNTVTTLFFASSTEFISPETFAIKANVPIPNAVVRSIDAPFTIGQSTDVSGNHRPFIVATTKNTARTIARMFDWEDTMLDDLAPIWLARNASSTAISRPVFIDRRIANLDTRVLVDDAGQGVILYTFFNNKYLIITSNEAALEDLLRRLNP